MMIKLNLQEKFVIGTFLIAVFVLTIGILTTEKATVNNTRVITGHLARIYRSKPARGSLNYDLYIKENNEHYKISADCADCFNYEDFTGNVKENHLVQMRIMNKNSLITNSDLRLVVALSCNGHEYLNTNCVNENIDNNRWLVPISWIIAITAGIVFWDVKRRKYKKNFARKKLQRG
ncbi:hypothetical protein [Mucilaginibacter sp. BT774]|uniref:hypothetical protein n=1 Tax=Mucilaginibacter sp. BT774 TaxID=3062276 RepID=UPI0026773C04|nr:hypothetical protein [Mucilaginibacter sp. BT774]MDO3628282.1 hypothetical protein [Mucilaginibacter sp. BT774]